MDLGHGVIIVGDELACTNKWITQRRVGHVLHSHIVSQEIAATDDVYCYFLLLLLRDGSYTRNGLTLNLTNLQNNSILTRPSYC